MTTYNIVDYQQIIELLASEGEERKSLYETSVRIKREQVGNIVYFRGIIDMNSKSLIKLIGKYILSE